MKKITPNIIHKIADKYSIKWDNNKNFMDWTETLTGKRHLDDMDENELLKVYLLLLAKKYPMETTNEDDLYLHRAVSHYVTPEKTEKLKTRLRNVYNTKDKKEPAKYIPLTALAKNIKNIITFKKIGE
jgi:hypothetical protein